MRHSRTSVIPAIKIAAVSIVLGLAANVALLWLMGLLDPSGMFGRRTVSDAEARRTWQTNHAAYMSVVEAQRQAAPGLVSLPASMKHLAREGRALVQREGKRLTVTFELDSWGIDNSMNLVYVEDGAGKGKSEVEYAFRSVRLDEHWFIVEGT